MTFCTSLMYTDGNPKPKNEAWVAWGNPTQPLSEQLEDSGSRGVVFREYELIIES